MPTYFSNATNALLRNVEREIATEGEMNRPESSLKHASLSSLVRLGYQSAIVCLLLTCSTGCSILHPLRGMPASYVSSELEGPRRSGKRTINPGLLVQTPPDQHRVAAGDILSIYIPGVLGRKEADVRQFGVEPPINQPFSSDDPPTIGYPITVRGDHTIALPQIPPIYALNMTLREVEQAIRQAYTVDHNILRAEEAMILVSLQRPRVHRILIVRQELGNELATGTGGSGTINLGTSKRGTARIVTLEAYENDVLHALATEEGVDGLPGLDAENTIYIIRRRSRLAHNQSTPNEILPIPVQQAQYSQRFGLPHQNFNQSQIQTVSATNQRGQSQFIATNYRLNPLSGQRTGSRVRPVEHSIANPYGSARPYTPAPQNPLQTNSLQLQASQQSPTPRRFGHQFGSPLPQQETAQPLAAPSQPVSAPVLQSPDRQLSLVPEVMPVPANTETHWSSMLNSFDPTIDNPDVIKIPVRLSPGEDPQINEEMITLYDGDIVFIESRETDVFYAGGLLGGGQYTLPREYDLGVLEAISIAEGGRTTSGGNSRSIGGVSAMNRDVSVSASRVIILRTLPNGCRITLEVDLHRAMRCQDENILVQPGDMLLLQYTALESIAAFTQRFLLEGALFGVAAAQLNGN